MKTEVHGRDRMFIYIQLVLYLDFIIIYSLTCYSFIECMMCMDDMLKYMLKYLERLVLQLQPWLQQHPCAFFPHTALSATME